MTVGQFLRQWALQSAIAVDQAINAICFPLGYADETLSARAWRAWRDGRPLGQVLRPMIDAIFFWQDQHCKAAYVAELQRRNLPPEYR
jgi:hypothetical protein